MNTTETYETLSSLRLKISQYIHGINTLENLQIDLIDITWSEDAAILAEEIKNLANHAELVIAEYTGHFISEQDLRRELLKMIST